MVLNNLASVDLPYTFTIEIEGRNIRKISSDKVPEKTGELSLTFNEALVFPGLINSHDHLDFNLFPQLGDQVYANYTAWGSYIHEHYKDEISRVLLVPVLLREQWGVLKNLICGVTTVVNHGERVKVGATLINVYERYHFLHSVKFDKRWKRKLNNPFKLRQPVVIHIGEGTDKLAYQEIDYFLSWNLLHKKLIGVHAVAMKPEQAQKFKAIVWCPESNYFLLNKTAAIDKLKKETIILFGTDSTLTGDWNIWNQIRLARKTNMLSDAELYATLNVNPSTIWKTSNGALKAGNDADLVISRIKNKQTGMDAFYAVEPKDILLVIQQGIIRLFDAELYAQLSSIDLSAFSKINIDGVFKYIQGDVSVLIAAIQKYYPEARFPVKPC